MFFCGNSRSGQGRNRKLFWSLYSVESFMSSVVARLTIEARLYWVPCRYESLSKFYHVIEIANSPAKAMKLPELEPFFWLPVLIRAVCARNRHLPLSTCRLFHLSGTNGTWKFTGMVPLISETHHRSCVLGFLVLAQSFSAFAIVFVSNLVEEKRKYYFQYIKIVRIHRSSQIRNPTTFDNYNKTNLNSIERKPYKPKKSVFIRL